LYKINTLIIVKNILPLFIAAALFSCKVEEKKATLYPDSAATPSESAGPALSPQATAGQEIFDGKGNCYTCHKPEEQAIGPSIREITKIYKEKKGDMVTFLKGNGQPIVDPSKYEVMKTNFYLTKTFTDEELKALEAYMNSY
jgi:cytochrome c